MSTDKVGDQVWHIPCLCTEATELVSGAVKGGRGTGRLRGRLRQGMADPSCRMLARKVTFRLAAVAMKARVKLRRVGHRGLVEDASLVNEA